MRERATHHPSFLLSLFLSFRTEYIQQAASHCWKELGLALLDYSHCCYYLENFPFGLKNRYDLMKQDNTTALVACKFLRKAWIGWHFGRWRLPIKNILYLYKIWNKRTDTFTIVDWRKACNYFFPLKFMH